MMNEVLQTIQNRRSVRSYRPEQIAEDTLAQILEAGIYAPSAHNDQPWHFTVVQNRDLIDEISDTAKAQMIKGAAQWVREMGSKPDFHLMYHAPALVIVSGRKNATASRIDCAAAMQNMLIAAESLGIGSVWIGLLHYFFEQKEAPAKLKIPEGYEPLYGAAFGYKADETKRLGPERNRDVFQYIR
jgi:nitroreductase